MKNHEPVSTDIFESPAQLLPYNPADILPLLDRVLLRDVKDPDKVGSIWIPQTAAERGVGKEGLLRLAVVVAVGPGDPWEVEKLVNGGTSVYREALGPCRYVGPKWYMHGKEQEGYPCDNGRVFDMPEYQYNECPECKGSGKQRWPMQVKVGQTVCVDRRKEGEFYFGGERHTICHEEQAVMGIVEGDCLLPIHDRILVEPVENAPRGVIEIPEYYKDKSQIAKVVAAGTGLHGRGMEVRAGQTVLLMKNRAQEINLRGKQYLTREPEVLAVLEDGQES